MNPRHRSVEARVRFEAVTQLHIAGGMYTACTLTHDHWEGNTAGKLTRRIWWNLLKALT